MSSVDFDVTDEEAATIFRIVDRALQIFERHGIAVARRSLLMDITACHANGCPLKLDELLAADDFTFSHDVGGIRQYLDRGTGRLTSCFVPRLARSPERG